MERRAELKSYIRSLCIIYYNKKGQFYKDAGIRRLIDKAKTELSMDWLLQEFKQRLERAD